MHGRQEHACVCTTARLQLAVSAAAALETGGGCLSIRLSARGEDEWTAAATASGRASSNDGADGEDNDDRGGSCSGLLI
jgi:hypothetical protein